jgi:hypothetical protein
MLCVANNAGCPLEAGIRVDKLVAERSSHFFEGLLLCFSAKCVLASLLFFFGFIGICDSNLREVEVSDHQEERRACYEDVVVVLVNGGESAGTSLSDCLTQYVSNRVHGMS